MIWFLFIHSTNIGWALPVDQAPYKTVENICQCLLAWTIPTSTLTHIQAGAMRNGIIFCFWILGALVKHLIITSCNVKSCKHVFLKAPLWTVLHHYMDLFYYMIQNEGTVLHMASVNLPSVAAVLPLMAYTLNWKLNKYWRIKIQLISKPTLASNYIELPVPLMIKMRCLLN